MRLACVTQSASGFSMHPDGESVGPRDRIDRGDTRTEMAQVIVNHHGALPVRAIH